jgi:hypothetical protein
MDSVRLCNINSKHLSLSLNENSVKVLVVIAVMLQGTRERCGRAAIVSVAQPVEFDEQAGVNFSSEAQTEMPD